MAKKPKKLKLRPEDRVQGMQSRQKRDLLAGCNEPGKQWFHPDVHVFQKTFCRICKNADCIRAKGAVSPWHTRMAEQVDYLLNDPNFSELDTPEHLEIAQQAFNDIGHKMMRLEIARQTQDWTIPDAPTDGYDKVASPDTTDQFDEAVKKLAKARGKEGPELDRPEQTNAPAHFQEQEQEEEDPYEYDTQFPSSDGQKSYHVILHKNGAWTCECDGYKNVKRCRHIATVRDWYEDQLQQNSAESNEAQSEPAPPPDPPPPRPAPERAATPPPDPRVPSSQAFNTPMPQGGVMIGGGQAPPSEMQPRPRERPHDPWAPRSDRVVEPGATVTVKSTKKKDE